ncbi:hypothetical protein [Psychrobacter immobilis]|uniref:hypothetical protein n=1 Tax=Psychrobacter immobilis TaxID=498 RepID=UPI00191A7D22|nr:hypothetical protein [Psychrobacter immobilis]
MYWVLGVAAAVGVVAWLSSEEQNACAAYNASSRRLSNETAERQHQISERLANYKKNQDFYTHIELHHASHLTASALYQQYSDHKKLVAMFYDKKQQFGRHIASLKTQFHHAVGIQKEQIKIQLHQMREQFEQAKQQLKILHELKTELLYELRYLNTATREYKLYIRDNCGQKGQDWYDRGIERKVARCLV